MKGLKASELKQLIHKYAVNDDEIVTKEAIDRLFDVAGDDYKVITLVDLYNLNRRHTEFKLERENQIKKAAFAYLEKKDEGESK